MNKETKEKLLIFHEEGYHIIESTYDAYEY